MKRVTVVVAGSTRGPGTTRHAKEGAAHEDTAKKLAQSLPKAKLPIKFF
jgi:hypothetical protein